MGIVGIGVDVVDLDRFAQALERTPELKARLFTEHERELRLESLAARFAAKEAISKALGAPPGMSWHDAEIVRNDSGAPSFVLRGTVLARAESLGVRRTHVSLSHDAGIATAYVVCED